MPPPNPGRVLQEKVLRDVVGPAGPAGERQRVPDMTKPPRRGGFVVFKVRSARPQRSAELRRQREAPERENDSSSNPLPSNPLPSDRRCRYQPPTGVITVLLFLPAMAGTEAAPRRERTRRVFVKKDFMVFLRHRTIPVIDTI